MSGYRGSYDGLCAEALRSRLRARRDHSAHYPAVEELLGFHYWLCGRLAPFHSSAHEHGSKYLPEVFVHVSFVQNMMSLFHAVRALECDSLPQCDAALRAVIESAVRMHCVSAFPGEALLVMAADVARGARDPEGRAKRLEEWKARAQVDAVRRMDTGLALERAGRYSFGGLVRRMYDEADGALIFGLYGALSRGVHSSLTGVKGSYDMGQAGAAFGYAKAVMYYSLAAEVEGHKRIACTPAFPLEECEGFMRAAGRALFGGGPSLLTPSMRPAADALRFGWL